MFRLAKYFGNEEKKAEKKEPPTPPSTPTGGLSARNSTINMIEKLKLENQENHSQPDLQGHSNKDALQDIINKLDAHRENLTTKIDAWEKIKEEIIAGGDVSPDMMQIDLHENFKQKLKYIWEDVVEFVEPAQNYFATLLEESNTHILIGQQALEMLLEENKVVLDTMSKSNSAMTKIQRDLLMSICNQSLEVLNWARLMINRVKQEIDFSLRTEKMAQESIVALLKIALAAIPMVSYVIESIDFDVTNEYRESLANRITERVETINAVVINVKGLTKRANNVIAPIIENNSKHHEKSYGMTPQTAEEIPTPGAPKMMRRKYSNN